MITRLRCENFKKLVAVSIEPTGHLVRICGKNAAGKSSVLDAIFAALSGKDALPKETVRRGADAGYVEVFLDEPPVVVRRRFDKDGGTSLVVESRDGARFPSPQRMLDELLGKLTFDPLAFSRLKPAEQVATLLDVVDLRPDPAKLDELAPDSTIADPLRRLEVREKALFDERTEKAREAKLVAGELAGIAPPTDTDPATSVNIALLARTRSDLVARGEERKNKLAGVQQLRDRATEIERQMEKLRAELGALEGRREQLAAEADAIPDHADRISALDEQIESAEAVNERYNAVLRWRSTKNRADLIEKAVAERTALIERIRAYRQELVAGAAMPVPGLSFADGGVTFGGIPLEQASSAEQLRVSAAIAMSLNPKLRVMLVREGSLLDDDSLRALGELAAAQGWQCWVESVDSSGKVGVVIEEGAVAAVNDAPATAQTSARSAREVEAGRG